MLDLLQDCLCFPKGPTLLGTQLRQLTRKKGTLDERVPARPGLPFAGPLLDLLGDGDYGTATAFRNPTHRKTESLPPLSSAYSGVQVIRNFLPATQQRH